MKKLLVGMSLLLCVANHHAQTTHKTAGRSSSIRSRTKFDFGAGTAAPGYTTVLPTTIFNGHFGFEPGAAITSVDRHSKDQLRGDFITGDRPFYFSVALPEGNYRVTLIFGDARAQTCTTVKAELRRLMLENVQTQPGQFVTRSFTVNIRTPKIAGGGEVKLKDRERATEIWAWDERLTLEFNGTRPAICGLEISRVENIPTLYLLGDSTVCDQPQEPYNSWGQMLTRFFNAGVVIANHAESGESIRSSLAARRFDKVLSLMKPGDYLLMQYGHNDQKEQGEGVGAFTTYKKDLQLMVAETRKRGGIPVLVTSVNRRNFTADGKVYSTLGDYPEAVRQVAKEMGVALIDLNAMSKTLYEALGPENSGLLFKEGDGTHHNNYGSYELAKCIVEGIRANKLKIAKNLVADVQRFDPAHPDPFEKFAVPLSLQTTNVKPPGN